MKITQEIKNKAIEIIENYNKNKDRKYIPRFQVTKGLLFLDRMDEGNITNICRLKFKGKMNNWDFAIYKYSSGGYSPDECFFPGEDYVDGTIEGAMKAGDKAYYMQLKKRKTHNQTLLSTGKYPGRSLRFKYKKETFLT